MINSLAITWDVSSKLISFTDSYAIRWYGILFSLGYVCAYYILLKGFAREKKPVILLEKMIISAIVGGVVGARLGHCFFYEPLRYLQDPIRLLYVWEGGLASHGAAIGILIAFWYVAKNQSVSYLTILSRSMIVAPLGGALIRLGNLMNSEIYGHLTNKPWGFIFIQSNDVQAGIEEALPRHPTQIYEALCYLMLFAFLQYYYWKKLRESKPISDMFVIGIFFIGTFLSRFFIEFFKGNQASFENDMFLNMGQLLSLPFIAFGIFALYKFYKQKQIKRI